MVFIQWLSGGVLTLAGRLLHAARQASQGTLCGGASGIRTPDLRIMIPSL
jgi:hypothetical protein